MIDLVTANEFTFTPSAFIAAYIEQGDKTEVTESESRGGTLDTAPKQIGNITVNVPAHLGTHDVRWQGTSGNITATIPGGSVNYNDTLNWGESLSPVPNVGLFMPTAITTPINPEFTKTGILGSTADGPITASGTILDIVGQIVSDTRTTVKTVTTNKDVANTVILVLSYGQFKAKCADAQSTVTLIYTRVSEYLNSLV